METQLVLAPVSADNKHFVFILSINSPLPIFALTVLLMSTLSRREPGDVINDCKVHFLDEIYQMEKPGARPLSAADGPFKRT